MKASEDELFRKVTARVLPLLCVAWVVCILDRLNLGFAALQMNADLGLSAAAYGLGAGLYFIGYLLFEVPSNLILARLGARVWIARIMVTWGLVSIAMAGVTGAYSFYAVRLLLGVAEAGFVPGAIYYVNQWFPASRVRRPLGILFAFGPLASAIGAPISTLIIQHSGWRWMFASEGIPAILIGVAVYLRLPNHFESANWLDRAEKEKLRAQLYLPRANTVQRRAWSVALEPASLLLCLQYFLIVTTSYAIQLWLPLIAHDLGFGPGTLPWVVAAPYALAAVAVAAYGIFSKPSAAALRHVVTFMSMAGAGFLLGAFTSSPPVILLCFCLVMCGTYLGATAYWTIPRSTATGAGAAAAIALSNASGNLGGFLGSSLIGAARDRFGSFTAALVVAGVASLIAAALTFLTAAPVRREATQDGVQVPSK
jgi:MFS transporter, ACS family, tartrate transporter